MSFPVGLVAVYAALFLLVFWYLSSAKGGD